MFTPNVYFQPPSGYMMKYPCVVYNRDTKNVLYADDTKYLSKQGYSLTVMDLNPDSMLADDIESHFHNCKITQYFTTDNIYHTTLKLFY